MADWISVKDRLPEEGRFVLVFCERFHNSSPMFVSRRLDFNYWGGLGRDFGITHWMPLPEPPKEG